MHHDLNALIAEAAAAYAATGDGRAMAAADLLRAIAETDPAAVLAEPDVIPDFSSALATVKPGVLRRQIESHASHLPWTTGGGDMPDGRYASAEVVGPDGLIPTQDLRFGFFWQFPDTFYPSHSHAAEELYLVLSGSPLWQKDDAPFTPVMPGTLVHHLPFQRHAMKTERDGLLAMWIWTGDLSFATYRFHET